MYQVSRVLYNGLVNSIQIKDKIFYFEIVRKPIRSIRLKLVDKNTFEVGCSRWVFTREIKNFIENNKDWIYKNSGKMIKKVNFSRLEELEVLGKKWLIGKRTKKEVEKILREAAKKVIKGELKKIENIDYGRVSIKNQKTRLGSCSGKNNLNFNWQIILFPYDKFMHIIYHEVAHLTEKNHGKKFWELVASYDKNWKENRKWLKTEGLKRIIF